MMKYRVWDIPYGSPKWFTEVHHMINRVFASERDATKKKQWRDKKRREESLWQWDTLDIGEATKG